jgi:hypothetical protein
MSDENNLSIEQFQEVFNTNEELRGQILETISSNDNGKAYLDNYAKHHFDSNIGARIGEIHGAYDKDLKELGFEKPDGVKSYEFVKETIKSLKEKAASGDPQAIEALRKENEELQSKIENNEQAKYFKDLHESSTKTFKEQLEEKEAQIQSFLDKQRSFQVEGELNKALTGFTLNDSLPAEVKDTFIQTVYADLLKGAKIIEDGSIAFYDGNGDLIVNNKTMGKATASEILADKLKSIIASKADTKGGGGQDGMGEKKPSNVTFANAKTKGELLDLIQQSLLSNGEVKGTKEFNVKRDELFVENGGDKLPLR